MLICVITMEEQREKTVVKEKEDYLAKYSKEIKAVMPLCVFDKKKTLLINKDEIIGKKLLVLKKEEHKNPFGHPYLVIWFGVITQQGFICWSNDKRSVAFTVTQSRINEQFYAVVDVGDIVTLSRQMMGRITMFPCRIIQKAAPAANFV